MTETTETKKTPARKSTANSQPKIHAALANVLSNMSVAKGGVLPGNMGGKPYITAVDLAAEAKRQFVDNGIIFVPNEEVTKHEVLSDDKGRRTVVVGIRGEYTLIHTADGSTLTISGIGDGLATGTAVASNIASTNAQKNALLRTFMVTEQSAEDAAKNGEQEPPESRAIAKARQPQAPKSPAPSPAGDFKAKILKEIIQNDADDRTKDDVNALWDAILKEKKLADNAANRTKTAEELYTRLKSGEVAA